MSSPVTFTEAENRMLQSIFMDLFQDDRVRSLEGPLIQSIVAALEPWPVAPTFTEQQNRRIQYQLEQFVEILKPYPYPMYPETFGQDTRQMTLIQSVQAKLIASQ